MSDIDWKYWLNMSTVTIGEAVALSMDIDPDPLIGCGTYQGYGYASDGFQNVEEQDEHDKRCRLLVNNAFSNKNIRGTEGLLTTINQPENASADIYLEYFPKWALSVEWDIPKELRTLVDPENLPAEEETTEEETTEEETTEEEIYALFDPLPRKTITKIFYDDTINWVYLFKRAPKNGLRELQEEGDLYNPAKIGDWLANNGRLTPEQTRRKLVKVLPTRSLGKEDKIILDYE